jgi:hypothetical protein
MMPAGALATAVGVAATGGWQAVCWPCVRVPPRVPPKRPVPQPLQNLHHRLLESFRALLRKIGKGAADRKPEVRDLCR